MDYNQPKILITKYDNIYTAINTLLNNYQAMLNFVQSGV